MTTSTKLRSHCANGAAALTTVIRCSHSQCRASDARSKLSFFRAAIPAAERVDSVVGIGEKGLTTCLLLAPAAGKIEGYAGYAGQGSGNAYRAVNVEIVVRKTELFS